MGCNGCKKIKDVMSMFSNMGEKLVKPEEIVLEKWKQGSARMVFINGDNRADLVEEEVCTVYLDYELCDIPRNRMVVAIANSREEAANIVQFHNDMI